MSEKSEHFLQAGDVIVAAKIGREALRFYERMGLLPPTARTQAGYRLYSQNHIRRIQLIQSAKGAGFTLNEIKDLFDRKKNDVCGAPGQREKCEATIQKKADALNAELNRIQENLRTLAHLSQTCLGG